MKTPPLVLILVGSLRKASLSRQVAKALATLGEGSLQFEFLELGELAMYNQDLEEHPPAGWLRLRERVRAADAVLFVTPEYNRSLPAVLKNALDIGSRPYGKSAWAKKPAAVVSVSPGPMGAFGANHHLRQCLVFLDMPTLQQPEAYIGHATSLFDEGGALVDARSREFLGSVMSAFIEWISRNHG